MLGAGLGRVLEGLHPWPMCRVDKPYYRVFDIAPSRPHHRAQPDHHTMPLPAAPKNQPNNSQKRQKLAQANNELLFKGILCMLIGLGVLLSPYFITSPGMQGIVAQSALVGWFALVLGVAFAGLYVRRRMASTNPS